MWDEGRCASSRGFREKIVSNEDCLPADRLEPDAAPKKPLSPAAARALAEAAERRRTATGTTPPARVAELGGPKGPEPTRYGDWAVKGRVSDF
jgi:hypothetical protein